MKEMKQIYDTKIFFIRKMRSKYLVQINELKGNNTNKINISISLNPSFSKLLAKTILL